MVLPDTTVRRLLPTIRRRAAKQSHVWTPAIYTRPIFAFSLCLAALALVAGTAEGATVGLKAGASGPYTWSVQASRPGGASGGLRPCLHLAIRGSFVPFSDTRCSALERQPLTLGLVDELDTPQVTLIAMAFGARYDRVMLYFNGSVKDRTVFLRELPGSKASKARLRPFRFLALAFLGGSCLERFVGVSSDGAVLFDSELMRCRESE
jgi:hypothetical protein